MGDAQLGSAPPGVVSEFPPPPVWYKSFKDANPDNDDFPMEPPVPITGKYFMFGVPYFSESFVVDELEDEGGDSKRRRLYDPTADLKLELKKLNRSVLASYTELLDALARCPSQSKEKLEDLKLLYLNMNNLINQLRPHLAREEIIKALQSQIDRRDALATEIKSAVSEARTLMDGASKGITK